MITTRYNFHFLTLKFSLTQSPLIFPPKVKISTASTLRSSCSTVQRPVDPGPDNFHSRCKALNLEVHAGLSVNSNIYCCVKVCGWSFPSSTINCRRYLVPLDWETWVPLVGWLEGRFSDEATMLPECISTHWHSVWCDYIIANWYVWCLVRFLAVRQHWRCDHAW